jgi:hypothetical protein
MLRAEDPFLQVFGTVALRRRHIDWVIFRSGAESEKAG